MKTGAGAMVACGIGALLLAVSTLAAPLRLALDWYPSIEFAGILIAQDRGWYQKAGIDLQITFAEPNLAARVSENQADVGLLSGHEILRLVAQGHRVKAFAAHYQFNPHTILVDPERVFKFSDLRGKTLALISEHERDIYKIMLETEGLSLKDVHLKKMPNSDPTVVLAALRAHKIAGLIGWEFDWPIVFALHGQPVRQFPGYKHGFYFYGAVYFARTEYLNSQKNLLRRFLDVTKRGWEEVYARPDASVNEIMDRWYPKNRFIRDSKVLTQNLQRTELTLSKRFLLEGIGEEDYGRMMQYTWCKSLQIGEQHGLVPKGKFKAEDFFDLGILNAPSSRDPKR